VQLIHVLCPYLCSISTVLGTNRLISADMLLNNQQTNLFAQQLLLRCYILIVAGMNCIKRHCGETRSPGAFCASAQIKLATN